MWLKIKTTAGPAAAPKPLGHYLRYSGMSLPPCQLAAVGPNHASTFVAKVTSKEAVWPFAVAQILLIALIVMVPAIATWLPSTMAQFR